MKQEYEHIFMVCADDDFIYYYLDTLIYRANVKKENMKVIVIDERFPERKVDGVKYELYDKSNLKEYSSSKTITFISLHSSNSKYMRDLFEFDLDLACKVHVFLTDDEVARWCFSIEKYGRVKSGKMFSTNKDVLFCLKYIKNFIKHEAVFRTKLSNVLGRNDIYFTNADGCFSSLPCAMSDELEIILKKSNDWSGKEKKILIGTKQKSFSIKNIIRIIWSFCRKGKGEEYKFLIFSHKKQRKERIFLDIVLIIFRHLLRQTINISYVTALSPFAYTSLVMSCSHMILQPRGGATTARLFMSWGQGVVCVPENSPNAIGRKLAYGVDLIEFNSFSGLVDGVMEDNVDVRKNAILVKEEEKRCWGRLGELYSS